MSWTLIEHQALSSSVASVTLGSGGTIPQTYKTLILFVSANTDRASQYADNIYVKPNASTSNLSYRRLAGFPNAPSVISVNGTDGTTGTTGATTQTANTFGSTTITFPNYAGSTNKPWTSDGVSENNATAAELDLTANLWSSTSAITSLVLAPISGTNFLSGSTFTLYGLA